MKTAYIITSIALFLTLSSQSQQQFSGVEYGKGKHYRNFNASSNNWKRSEVVRGGKNYSLVRDRLSKLGRLGSTGLFSDEAPESKLIFNFIGDEYAESYLVDIFSSGNKISLILKHPTGYRYIILRRVSNEYNIMYACDFLHNTFSPEDAVQDIKLTSFSEIIYKNENESNTVKFKLPNYTINGVKVDVGIAGMLRHSSYTCQGDLYNQISHSSLRLIVWPDYFQLDESDKAVWQKNIISHCPSNQNIPIVLDSGINNNFDKYIGLSSPEAKTLAKELKDSIFIICEDGVVNKPNGTYAYYFIINNGKVEHVNFTATGPVDPVF